MCYNIVTSFETVFEKAKQYLPELSRRGLIALERAFRAGRMGAAGDPDGRVNLEDAGRVGEPGEDWTSGCTGRRLAESGCTRERLNKGCTGRGLSHKAYLQKAGAYSSTGYSMKSNNQ